MTSTRPSSPSETGSPSATCRRIPSGRRSGSLWTPGRLDVMPNDDLCQVEAVPCTESRQPDHICGDGTKIESNGEKKFQAVTDDGFLLDCKFISGAVKKILKSTATTCDEGGDQGQWVVHTKTGGWIVNVEPKWKIPLRRVGNTYFMDAWVRVPDNCKDKSKEKMEIDGVNTKKAGFTWPR